MSTDEVAKIMAILVEVDGGCPACVETAMDSFASEFPKHQVQIANRWMEYAKDYRIAKDEFNSDDWMKRID